VQLGVTELCCACHSSSIAALIYIMLFPTCMARRLYKCKIRAPSFAHLSAMDFLTRGHLSANVPQSSDRSISYSGRLVDEAVASGRAKLKGRVTQQAFELAGNVVHIFRPPAALCGVRFAAPCMAALWAVPFLLRLAGGQAAHDRVMF